MSAVLKSRLPEIAAELKPRVTEAIAESARAVELAAKARTPVQSGNLRDAIHTERQGDSVYVVAGDQDVFYGHMVEHGTSHSAPRPFLVPALEESKDGIVAAVNVVLRAL